MKKILTRISLTVIILFALSAFGWMVKHVSQGSKDFGKNINQGLTAFVSFIDLFEKSVEEVQKLPETFIATPEDFEAINRLEQDVIALVSYSNESKGRTVEMRNLRNDSVLHQWEINNPPKASDRIMDPLLLPNKALCYSFNGVSGLKAIDASGELLWQQDSIKHHHSMNLDSDGNIWACTFTREKDDFLLFKSRYFIGGREMVFIDNTITQLESTTGEILFHKSITQILQENNLGSLVLKSSVPDDPLHLNDIQPALKSTAWYQEGDLFLSFRNISAILQYRPSTNEVVRLIEGLFYSQHDVDFLNDSVIYFFNNNTHRRWLDRENKWMAVADTPYQSGSFYSNVMAYDLKNEDYFYLAKEVFEQNEIYTFTEGMSELIGDSLLFVEEQNSGELWILKGDEVVYKNVLKSHHPKHHHMPNWTRIIHDSLP